MGKNNNSNGYLFLTLILSEIKDLGKQGSTTNYLMLPGMTDENECDSYKNCQGYGQKEE